MVLRLRPEFREVVSEDPDVTEFRSYWVNEQTGQEVNLPRGAMVALFVQFKAVGFHVKQKRPFDESIPSLARVMDVDEEQVELLPYGQTETTSVPREGFWDAYQLD